MRAASEYGPGRTPRTVEISTMPPDPVAIRAHDPLPLSKRTRVLLERGARRVYALDAKHDTTMRCPLNPSCFSRHFIFRENQWPGL